MDFGGCRLELNFLFEFPPLGLVSATRGVEALLRVVDQLGLLTQAPLLGLQRFLFAVESSLLAPLLKIGLFKVMRGGMLGRRHGSRAVIQFLDQSCASRFKVIEFDLTFLLFQTGPADFGIELSLP